uniref:uncharacterized protein n=1 Tax=Centroberyx gerrardi TaxID=166262 RepID=UPI003AABB2CD
MPVGFPTPDLSYQRGVRYTYRYSTTVTTTLHGSNSGRNGLALDCVVDIEVISKCHLMMQIRNPQIKRLSPQKEHSVQRLKSLRDSLERARLKFSLQGGKVAALCPQEGEQVWALNIKRALLSMLQTSRTTSRQEVEKETDVYGTCSSRYERRGPALLKTRDLKQCQQSRLSNFWPHSVSLTEDTTVHSELQCLQRHGAAVMEEVNCTEAVSMATWSGTAGLVKTQTVSTLLLLRAQPGAASGVDSSGVGVLTGLQFEEEGAVRPGKARPSTPQQASETVRMLCGLISDQQQMSQQFLQLAFQLRDLSLSQLKTLWQEASFKCRNDWQPLLDALPACGSESCILLLTDLMRTRELEDDQAHSYLTTIALIPHPSPQIIDSINALLEISEVRSKALLAGSSLVYLLCQRSRSPCSNLPQVQTFIQTLEETLREGCEGEEPTRTRELLYALKSVGNAGPSASALVPLLSRCALGQSAAIELRLAAIQAFRRIPCSADRSLLLQLYRSSQEDPEVRIAAYQQLMRCPDPEALRAVKTTLSNETSSQVGSFVWSHLTNVLRSEDPMKQALIESLPDDIISRDFEAEFLKYSSYSDYTVGSGMGIANLEGSLVFSPKSFLPRSAMANLTVYFHGRAHNLLEVDLHVENAEPLLKNIFGHRSHTSDREPAARNGRHLSGRSRAEQDRPRCWVGVKVFGNELSLSTCDDLYTHIHQLSLSMAGLAVKLLKGQEVQLSHRAVLLTEELVLPSLSGMPIKLGINMTSLLSLRLKGNANYRETTHFSLAGYIKPSAYVGLAARMGVDGALGQAGVDWVSELRSSTSLDGSVHLQEGQDLRVTLNTPEDLMDIISLSSRVFQVSGDHREEIKGPKSRIEKTTCTPKTWSKMVGWQLCSNASYPLPAVGVSLPPPGPVHLSLRLLKLDRGLHYYLLEAAYSLLTQRGSWLPREASLHLLLATPQSSIPRDTSLDLVFNPHRLLLKIRHPLKTIHIQGQLDQERNVKTGKLELLIDSVHYYIMGLVDTQTILSEQRTRYHLEAKMAADGRPMILSANVTRGLGRKTSFSATVKNVFRETASLSVALERRLDDSNRQYSVEAELLLPGVVGSRILGLMERKGGGWSSALRLKYGLGDDARHLRQECYMSQSLRSERDPNLSYIMRADHEFYCSNTAHINHKIQLRHEESPSHTKCSLDMSYGKHWDEINNKRTLLLSQSFKNQTTQNHTSYTLEFSLQVPEKHLTYRTQLLHSHLRESGSESSTHLKVNYNDLMPLVAGLHWKSPPRDALQKKWEGTFNMDTPWLYVYTAHKLSQPQRHTLQLTSELTARKWLTVRNLILEGLYRDRGREREVRLDLYTPAVTYLKAGGWGVVGKRGVKASCSFSSLWSPPLRGDVSLEASKYSHTLQMASSYGKHNLSLAAALKSTDKNLKKKQVMLKMTLSEPRSPSTELELEGAVEELRKDKRMYQKTAMLRLRQPFQTFPQSLLLRETFTIDLLKGLYILESRAGFHGNREVVHTLTLGYQPPSPFVCSALIHPFSSYTIPSDSEICVTISSNQAEATADISMVGRGSSSVHVRADGKDRVLLDAQMSHSLQRGDRAVGLRLNLSQSLLPTATDLHLDMAANVSSDSVSMHGSYIQGHEVLLAQVGGSLNHTQGLQLAVSGDLRHSMASLTSLPSALGLDGALGQSDTLTEGHLRVRVLEALYSVELRHQEDPGESWDGEDEEGMMGKESSRARDWLCARSGAESLCVNVSRELGGQGRGGVYAQLSHSSHLLSATGIPANSSAQVSWAQEAGGLSVLAELQAGAENLTAEFNGGRTGQPLPGWEFLSRLQHQIKPLLKRGLSSSIQAKAHYQMNCTGDATADRLSGQCYGSVAGRPVEVRAFRSYRPHSRLCYGLALAHLSLSAQAKGCYSPHGQTEIRANLTHSSRLLLMSLGLPTNSSLRLLLRPGPLRWALGMGLAAGPWRADLSVGLRLEMAGLYGWHGLVEYGTPGVTHKAEVTGRMRLESWCHVWVDVSGAWDSVSSSLLVSVRCGGVGRLVWMQVRGSEGGAPHRTSLAIRGRAGKDGLKGSLGLENQQDSLQCLLSVLLKDHKAEVGWTLQHHWASLASTIPERVDLQGSGQLLDTSLSGSARVSFDTRSAQLDVTSAWEPYASLRVTLQHNLATLMSAGVPEGLTVSMLSGSSQARLETLLPPQSSVNVSINHSGCSTNLDTHLQAGGEEKGSLSLSVACHPHLRLRASIQHSIEGIQALGFPTRGALVLGVSTTNLPGVEVGLELGHCYFRVNLGETKASETERNQSSYAVNVTNYCPALQGTILPVSLVLQGLLAVFPCQLTLSSTLRADNQDLTLELGQSCRPPRLSGTLTHSFPGLRSRGLPQTTTIEASAPGGPGQAGALLIKAGACHIRAEGIMEAAGRTQWLWAVESECPFLQAHLNGSVWQDSQGVWTAKVDTGVEGNRGSLWLNARARPELRLESELSHNLPALRSLPEHGRLLVTGRAGAEGYDTEALIQMEECAVRARGAVISRPDLQGSLVYYNNCTVLQVSMAIDNRELQALMALKKMKDKNEASIHLNHSVPLLKKVGLPTDAALTMNTGNHGNGSYYFLSRCSTGNQQLTQEMTVAKTSESVTVKSLFRHTVNCLKKLGVPGNNSIKGLCSIQGGFSQLQSKAQLTVDKHKLLDSGLNVSVADGRLAMLLSYSPPASSQTGTRHSLDTTLTAQFKGPLRSVSIDVRCTNWRVRVVGDVGGWATHGSKEARVTLKHNIQGQISPVLQVEAWGRLTDSQLRCSMAVNPELSSSLALIVQGHRLPDSKELMVKVVQNIPQLLVYLPAQLNTRSQLNQSQSSVAGLVELSSGRRKLWALGELASIDGGYRQALELNHSYPQLKPLPRTVAVRTLYEARNWSYQVQHGAVWGNQEFSLAGLYSVPPALEMGNHTLKVQITCVPRWSSLEVTLERSLQARLDSVLLGWSRHGRLEQVRALSLWSQSEEINETKVELKQPFTSTLSRLSLHTLSHVSQREQRSSHQTHLSWDSVVPVNISLSLNKRWQDNSSRGQACALFSSRQVGEPSPISSLKGCVSVGQEGNSYSQNAELRWDNRSVKQGMKYQNGLRGMHSLQISAGLENVSPAPCPSHSLLAKVQTNLRDRLEHTVLLGLCPPRPTLSWSGSHRVNSGEELFYTQTRLSVTGRPYQCSLTLALTNSSTVHGTNISLFSESRIGNWSVEVGGSALSSPRGSGLQVQARLDRSENLWLNGTLEGRCLQTTAGYRNGSGLDEDLTVAVCVDTNWRLTLDVQKREDRGKPEALGSVSMGTANQSLVLRAHGCSQSLFAVEARVHYLSSQIRNKLLERIKTLQHLLMEFRRQSRDSELLQELSAVPLHVTQRAEALLGQRERGLWAPWRSSPLRHILTDSLPRFLGLLQHASLLGQQELRRPLATLAGVYHDVTGQRLEALWRQAVSLWTARLAGVLPPLLENAQLRPLAQAGVASLSTAMELAGQQTFHWVETRLATALSGVRKRLASVYKLSPSECSVLVAAPLPRVAWSRVAEAGVVEVVLEEWLLRPLQALASVRPTAELYRLKRRIMDSPFKHQALLVADQFVVSFDGRLYELPGSCPFLLAQDVTQDPSFTLLLGSDPHSQRVLVVEMNNSTISIQQNGQVKANCHAAHAFHNENGVAIKRGSNTVEVSNQNGVSVSCDQSLDVCSLTLDGWLHGMSTGLLGTNDNEAGNDFPLPDGSQAGKMADFFYSWQMRPECIRSPAITEPCSKVATSPVNCDLLFSSPDSPLSSCFRVVDPGQFLSVCEMSHCGSFPGPSRSPCRLAAAFVHLCQQNYIPLEVPVQCLQV